MSCEEEWALRSLVFEEPYCIRKADRYVIKEKIGEGAFGQVHFARDRVLGEAVALKSIKCCLVTYSSNNNKSKEKCLPKAIFRELYALRRLKHQHIVPLLDVYPEADSVVLVQEFMKSDLANVLDSYSTPICEGEAKSWSLQLLCGVAHMHSAGLMHRDLKPGNLLINHRGILKIGDLGQTRVFTNKSDRSLSHQVATRWYRAPELLLGSRRYTNSVDLWSIGCIIAELILHKPIFPGQSDIDQLLRVLHVTGSPTPHNWPGVNHLPDYGKILIGEIEPKPFVEICPAANVELLDLIGSLLMLDPDRRISAEQAIGHDWFKSKPKAFHPSSLTVPERAHIKSKPDAFEQNFLETFNSVYSQW